MILMYLIQRQAPVALVAILACIMALTICGFIAYHLFLIWAGTTTNESYKWKSVAKIHKRLVAAHNKYISGGGVPQPRPTAARPPAVSGDPALVGFEYVLPDGHVGCAPSVSSDTSAEDTRVRL